MAGHEIVHKSKSQGLDQKYHTRQQDEEPLVDQFHSLTQDAFPITETPFQPLVNRHVALLSQARSDAQRANLVVHLQRTYGNAYVQRLLESHEVQAKLTVSSTNDIYEKKADRVSEKVIRVVNSKAQRQEDEEEEEVTYPGPRMKSLREEAVQRRAGAELGPSPSQRGLELVTKTEAIDLGGNCYGWDRDTDGSDVETVVNSILGNQSGPTETTRIVIFSGTHGTEKGHLANIGAAEFADEDQATADAAMANSPGAEIEVIDVPNSYPTKASMSPAFTGSSYIRILAWCFSKQSFDNYPNIKSNWWPPPDHVKVVPKAGQA